MKKKIDVLFPVIFFGFILFLGFSALFSNDAMTVQKISIVASIILSGSIVYIMVGQYELSLRQNELMWEQTKIFKEQKRLFAAQYYQDKLIDLIAYLDIYKKILHDESGKYKGALTSLLKDIDKKIYEAVFLGGCENIVSYPEAYSAAYKVLEIPDLSIFVKIEDVVTRYIFGKEVDHDEIKEISIKMTVLKGQLTNYVQDAKKAEYKAEECINYIERLLQLKS